MARNPPAVDTRLMASLPLTTYSEIRLGDDRNTKYAALSVMVLLAAPALVALWAKAADVADCAKSALVAVNPVTVDEKATLAPNVVTPLTFTVPETYSVPNVPAPDARMLPSIVADPAVKALVTESAVDTLPDSMVTMAQSTPDPTTVSVPEVYRPPNVPVAQTTILPVAPAVEPANAAEVADCAKAADVALCAKSADATVIPVTVPENSALPPTVSVPESTVAADIFRVDAVSAPQTLSAPDAVNVPVAPAADPANCALVALWANPADATAARLMRAVLLAALKTEKPSPPTNSMVAMLSRETVPSWVRTLMAAARTLESTTLPGMLRKLSRAKPAMALLTTMPSAPAKSICWKWALMVALSLLSKPPVIARMAMIITRC